MQSLVKMTNIAFLLVVAGSIGCSGPETGDKDSASKETADAEYALDCGETSHDASASTIRLKGASMLAQSFQAILNEGVTRDPSTGDEMFNKPNIINGLGSSKDGLYADIKSKSQTMTQYVMTLNFVGRSAALNCAADDFLGRCQCNTEEAAAAMLQRAIPFRRFCAGVNDPYVKEFLSLCNQNSADAISMLMTSISVALLQ